MIIHLPTWIAFFIAWAIMIALFSLRYKKTKPKIKLHYAFFVFLVSIFTLSLNIGVMKIPILPLGVWICFWICKRKNLWPSLRKFSWLGFICAFIWSFINLLSIPIENFMYPEDKLSSYVSNFDDALLIRSHNSANQASLNNKVLRNLTDKNITIDEFTTDWYYKKYMDEAVPEQFPYQLTQVTPAFGAGIKSPQINVSKDGKKLLIITPKKQALLKLQQSILHNGGTP